MQITMNLPCRQEMALDEAATKTRIATMLSTWLTFETSVTHFLQLEPTH